MACKNHKIFALLQCLTQQGGKKIEIVDEVKGKRERVGSDDKKANRKRILICAN